MVTARTQVLASCLGLTSRGVTMQPLLASGSVRMRGTWATTPAPPPVTVPTLRHCLTAVPSKHDSPRGPAWPGGVSSAPLGSSAKVPARGPRSTDPACRDQAEGPGHNGRGWGTALSANSRPCRAAREWRRRHRTHVPAARSSLPAACLLPVGGRQGHTPDPTRSGEASVAGPTDPETKRHHTGRSERETF